MSTGVHGMPPFCCHRTHTKQTADYEGQSPCQLDFWVRCARPRPAGDKSVSRRANPVFFPYCPVKIPHCHQERQFHPRGRRRSTEEVPLDWFASAFLCAPLWFKRMSSFLDCDFAHLSVDSPGSVSLIRRSLKT